MIAQKRAAVITWARENRVRLVGLVGLVGLVSLPRRSSPVHAA